MLSLCLRRQTFWTAWLLLATSFICARAEAETSVDAFAAQLRAAVNKGQLVLEPHRFEGKGFLQGGVQRSASEFVGQSPMAIIVDTYCILEAGAVGIGRRRQQQVFGSCRDEIRGHVKAQLKLLEEHTGSKDELLEKLSEEHQHAQSALAAALARYGYQQAAQGGKRWDVTFETIPEGGKVYIMNAGDYALLRWYQQENRRQAAPDWILAHQLENFGHKCKYYVCAKWDDGSTCEAEPILVTRNLTVTLRPDRK